MDLRPDIVSKVFALDFGEHSAQASTPINADLLGLLDAVKDQPDEDAPRLILADWLEKNGRDESEKARGELIRIQCKLSRRANNDTLQPEELKAREQELIRRHLGAWLSGLPIRENGLPPNKEASYRGQPCVIERGFLRLWNKTGQRWLDAAPPDSPFWAWIDGLCLVDLRLPEISEVAASPILEQVNFLQLGPDGWSGWTDDKAPGPQGARILASSSHLKRLTHLDLSDCVIRPDGAKAIAESPNFHRLTHLHLGGWDCTPANLIGDEGAKALANSEHLSSLTYLDLMENVITADGAQAIANSPAFSRLTYLNLMGNPLGAEGARAIAASPFLGNLTFLGLDFSPLDPDQNVRAVEDACELLQQRFGKAWERT